MIVVVDASVVVDLILNYRSEPIQELWLNGSIAAPHLLDAEVGQVLRRLFLTRVITKERLQTAFDDYASLRIQRYPHYPLLHRALKYAENVTFYDALYVALTKEIDGVFVTRDKKLSRAVQSLCKVQVP